MLFLSLRKTCLSSNLKKRSRNIIVTIMLMFSGISVAFSLDVKPVNVQANAVSATKIPVHAQFNNSLLQELGARRDVQSDVIVYGKINLPEHTKLKIAFKRIKPAKIIDESDAVVGVNGQFQSFGLRNDGSVIEGGEYLVILTSYFNETSQSSEVLEQTGIGGKKLPAAALVGDDPEFPDAAGHIEISEKVTLDNISPEAFAIEEVKNSKLLVKGKGLSKSSVAAVIAWNEGGIRQPPPFKVLRWSAIERVPGIWIVTLDYSNEEIPYKASWEYNSKTHAVNYLDANSKALSRLPDEALALM